MAGNCTETGTFVASQINRPYFDRRVTAAGIDGHCVGVLFNDSKDSVHRIQMASQCGKRWCHVHFGRMTWLTWLTWLTWMNDMFPNFNRFVATPGQEIKTVFRILRRGNELYCFDRILVFDFRAKSQCLFWRKQFKKNGSFAEACDDRVLFCVERFNAWPEFRCFGPWVFCHFFFFTPIGIILRYYTLRVL